MSGEPTPAALTAPLADETPPAGVLGRDASCSPLTEAHSGDKLDTFIQYCVTRWEREKPFRKRLLSEITMRIGETLHEHRKATGRAS